MGADVSGRRTWRPASGLSRLTSRTSVQAMDVASGVHPRPQPGLGRGACVVHVLRAFDEGVPGPTDPLEHRNLAAQPENKEIIERLRLAMPKHNEPDSPANNLSPEEKKDIAKGARKGKKAAAEAAK